MPTVKYAARDPVGFPFVMPRVEVVIFPLPLYVCAGHKLTPKQAQSVLTKEVREKLARLAGDFDLRLDRAWVIHERIGDV